MEDEYQSTLKKKISILFQLGKWPDVIKLCESYAEKYGKDMEIDMIRFKSERQLGLSAPRPKEAETKNAPAAETNQPLVLDDEDAVDDDSVVFPDSPPENEPSDEEYKVSAIAADEAPLAREDKIAYDPSGDDADLIITDPFEESEPGFSLADDEPPVILSDRDENDRGEVAAEPTAERTDAAEQSEAINEESEIDFNNLGAMTIDADPQLTPESPSEKLSEPDATEEHQKVWEDPSRSTSGGSEFLGEEPEAIPSFSAQSAADETPQDDRKTSREFSDQMRSIRKKAFPFKLLLWILLPLAVAVLAWLLLSGRLTSSGDEAPRIESAPVAKPLVNRPLPPAKKVSPPAVVSATLEKDKAFDEKFQQASALFKKGDMLKAWAVVLEAKKIKMTEPLRLLEEQLAARIRADEARTTQESQAVQSQWQLESQAFAKAEAENSMEGWQNFLKNYPSGEFAFKAEKKIDVFKKKAQENLDQQFLLKIKQLQKIKLRSTYLSLGQADISALLRRSAKSPSQFESHEHAGARVMLDFVSGLMWTLWNKPMAFDKAKWWSNRVTAGYGGWRLPSTEEAMSLLQIPRAQYAGLAGFAVWTGDTVSDQPRTAWVLKLPEGQFAAAAYSEIFYVWAVRKAGK
jgi:hypothetical protein